MNKSELIRFLEERKAAQVKLAFADVDGILRGKVIRKEKFLETLDSGLRFCDVVFGWDSQDRLYSNSQVTGWHSGFPDGTCFPDPGSMRLIPYQNNIPFVLADFGVAGQTFCPRSLLKKVSGLCEDMGYHAEFAQEFEWYNFLENAHSLQLKGFKGLQPLSPGMFGYSILRTSQHSEFYYDLFSKLEMMDIAVEGLHTETGPGVYEAAIEHRSLPKAADDAVVFKNAVKEIASLHGIAASFMAKFNSSLPGCSGHIHQSLWSADGGTNLFFDTSEDLNMSKLMRHYLAGQLFCLPYIMPMYAPTVNSYKRLVEGAWAPTRLCWGVENRTAAIRVLNSSEKLTRLEMRVPGSDSNPYLAMAASLASGLYGIRHELGLYIPEVQGNAYGQKDLEYLPDNLKDATEKMKRSEIAAELFGKGFCEHFIQSREWEWQQYALSVSDWELNRYFEII